MTLKKTALLLFLTPILGGGIGAVLFLAIKFLYDLYERGGVSDVFLETGLSAWLFSLVFAYPGVVLWGLPIHSIFVRYNIHRLWPYMISGILGGLLCIALYMVVWIYSHSYEYLDELKYVWLLFLWGALFGGSNALAGWLLLRWK